MTRALSIKVQVVRNIDFGAEAAKLAKELIDDLRRGLERGIERQP